MTPEDRNLLEETHDLVKENNQILRSMRRTTRITTILRLCYWLVIILISVGAYYLIQPYVETILGGNVSQSLQNKANQNDLLNSLLQ